MEIARDKNNNHMQAVVIDTAYNVEQGQTLKLGEGEPIVYPYPLLDNQMVEALLETSEWSNINE